MISVINGDLFQWDIGRKIKIVSKKGYVINEVNFCNQNSDNALVGKVYYEDSIATAYIPNILLQSDKDLIVYAISTIEDSNQVIERSIISIHKRAKPDNYVYTETEVFKYEALEQKIKELEEKYESGGTVSPEQVQEAVEEALQEAKDSGEFNGSKGDNGDSAFDVWLSLGNEGDAQDFLDSLKGDKGDKGKDGDSAYQSWLNNGNSGSETDFLESIKGEKGNQGVSGVYVGSSPMPEGYNVHIDLEGEADDLVTRKEFNKLAESISNITNTREIVDSVSGNNVLVTDSANEPLKGMRVFGKSEQNTISGNQLIPYPYSNTTKTVNGITFTDEGDGWISISGTSTAEATFMLCNAITIDVSNGDYVSVSKEISGDINGVEVGGWSSDWKSFFEGSALVLNSANSQSEK